MSTANVVVVVPVFNRQAIVGETLDSVAAQTLPPKQLVIVDDGSTDATAKVVERWIEGCKLPSAKLIRRENGGVATARNLGFAEADEAEYVAFLDSDDLWPRDYLARATRVLNEHHAAVAATADREFLRAHKTRRRRDDLREIGEDATRWLFCNDGAIASCTLFRSSMVRRLGGFSDDTNILSGEDSELFLRVSLSRPWFHLPGDPVVMRRGFGQGTKHAANLSAAFDDGHRRWAWVHERFVLEQGGSDVLPRSVCSRVLGRRWHLAGKQLAKYARHVEACVCFRRSLDWQRWNQLTWLRLCSSQLRRAA